MEELTLKERQTIYGLINNEIHRIKNYYASQFRLAYTTNLIDNLKEHYDSTSSEINYLEGIKKKISE